jgi:hypothetical protein
MIPLSSSFSLITRGLFALLLAPFALMSLPSSQLPVPVVQTYGRTDVYFQKTWYFHVHRKECQMDKHGNLNLSSPIVQRVLRLRERVAQEGALIVPLSLDNHPDTTDTLQAKKSYQWQMWQKSDFFAYIEDEPGYRCKD